MHVCLFFNVIEQYEAKLHAFFALKIELRSGLKKQGHFLSSSVAYARGLTVPMAYWFLFMLNKDSVTSKSYKTLLRNFNDKYSQIHKGNNEIS